jgi:hypothetical protein
MQIEKIIKDTKYYILLKISRTHNTVQNVWFYLIQQRNFEQKRFQHSRFIYLRMVTFNRLRINRKEQILLRTLKSALCIENL